MIPKCTCPLPAAIETVEYNPCVNLLGKMGRFAFQVTDDASNAFVDAVNGIELEASWTPLPDALDVTKVAITPLLENVVFGDQSILEDSENLDGAPVTTGVGPQVVTFEMRNLTKEQLSALKALSCQPSVSVYGFDNISKILAREIADTPATYAGLKISPGTLIFKDPQKGGTLADQSKVMGQFQLAYGWADAAEVVSAETGFNPVEDVKPA